jgi:LIM domain kinase 1
MSPEMVNGEDFDLATDVYTLGLVFIELLSRKLAARWLFTVSSLIVQLPVMLTLA